MHGSGTLWAEDEIFKRIWIRVRLWLGSDLPANGATFWFHHLGVTAVMEGYTMEFIEVRRECPGEDEGWCVDCVVHFKEKLKFQIRELRNI